MIRDNIQKKSEYPKPRDVRDGNHDDKQDDQDLVSAFLTDAEKGGVAVVTIGRSANPAGF